jgi:hypothetical protein
MGLGLGRGMKLVEELRIRGNEEGMDDFAYK